mgnify:CR=1 FL=1
MSKRRVSFSAVASSLMLLGMPLANALNPGDLMGSHTENLGGIDSYNAVIVKDGKIIVAGTSDVNGSLDTVVAKYEVVVGGLAFDPTFNAGAPIIHDYQLGPMQESNGTWVDVDGIDTDNDGVDDDYEIYAGGTIMTAAAFGGALKFSSDGVLDTGYANSGEGIVCADSISPSGFVNDSGEVFMAGTTIQIPMFETSFSTGKLLDTGFADLGFASQGCEVEWAVVGTESAVKTIDYDGKVLTAGITSVTNEDVHLIRYLSTGGYDTTFGTGGKVTTSSITIGGIGYHPYTRDVAVMKFGVLRRIVVVGLGLPPGGGTQELFITRYFGNGNLNTAFGTGGVVNTNLGLAGMIPEAVAIDRNFKIVVAGSSINGMWVARFDAMGNPDLTFGVGGLVTVAGFERVSDMVITENGLNILVVGKGGGDGFIKMFKG